MLIALPVSRLTSRKPPMFPLSWRASATVFCWISSRSSTPSGAAWNVSTRAFMSRGCPPPASSKRLVRPELLCEECDRVRAPCEVAVGEHPAERVADVGEARRFVAERSETAAELRAAFGVVEIGGERLAGTRIERQLAVQVAAGRVDEQRASHRGRALLFVEVDAL